jgi:hypothetical protein
VSLQPIDRFWQLLIPPKVTIVDSENRQVLVYCWGRPEYWLVLVMLCSTVLSRGWLGLSLGSKIFLSIFSYVALASTLNRTIVEVSKGTLSVRHRPMPWRGNCSLPIDGIESVYCGWIESTKWKRIYDIRILTKTGKSLTIVSSIREESIAQSIVVQLKKWLLVSKEFD